MLIRQDAEISTAILQAGHHLTVDQVKKVNYVHLIKGELKIGEHVIKAGNALVFEDAAQIEAVEDSRMSWFNLP